MNQRGFSLLDFGSHAGHESDIRKYPNTGYMGTLWLALQIQSVVNKGKGRGKVCHCHI